ncbi:MAG: hypothetical protein WBN31_05660 [Gammaproteobacteria bacterium]
MTGPDPYFDQPRGVMTVIVDGFRLALRALSGAWGPVLITVLIYLLIGPTMRALTGIDPYDLGFGVPEQTVPLVSEPTAAVALGLYGLVNILLLMWVFALLLQHMQRAARPGDASTQDPVSPIGALRRVPAMIGASLLVAFILVLSMALMARAFVALDGMLALVLMLLAVTIGGILTLILMLGPALPVLENTGPIASLSRSTRLVWPCWLRISWLFLLVVLLNIAVTLVLGLAVTLLIQLLHPETLSGILGWILNPLFGVGYMLFGAGLTVSLYYDLLARGAASGDDGQPQASLS